MDQSGSGIEYNIGGAKGTLQGTHSQYLSPDIAPLRSGGGFVVAMQRSFGPSDQDAVLHFYDGSASRNLFATGLLNGATSAIEQAPAVAVLKSGYVAVAYERELSDGSGTFGMAIEIYTPTGTRVRASTPIDLAGSQNRRPDIVALKDGGFAVAYEDNGWGGESGMTIAFLTSSGVLRGARRVDDNTRVEQDANLALLKNGYVAVTYTDSLISGTDYNINRVIFDPASNDARQRPHRDRKPKWVSVRSVYRRAGIGISRHRLD